MPADPVSHPSGDPDAALIERIQGGDPEAFDGLVRRHQQLVYAVACRLLGNPQEAEDAAQDVFVRAFRAIGGFRREAKVSTWLVAITVNVCRNQRRWWARRRRLIAGSLDAPAGDVADKDPPEPPDPGPDPAVLAHAREQQRVLLSALASLDEASRAVVVLRDLQGCAYDEIARMLGCRLGTVKSRLNRARLRLRALLDGRL